MLFILNFATILVNVKDQSKEKYDFVTPDKKWIVETDKTKLSLRFSNFWFLQETLTLFLLNYVMKFHENKLCLSPLKQVHFNKSFSQDIFSKIFTLPVALSGILCLYDMLQHYHQCAHDYTSYTSLWFAFSKSCSSKICRFKTHGWCETFSILHIHYPPIISPFP